MNYVYTSSGKVAGYIENKVINFDDIPYAKPPVGELRWKAPRDLFTPNNIIEPKDNNLHSRTFFNGEELQERILQEKRIVYI